MKKQTKLEAALEAERKKPRWVNMAASGDIQTSEGTIPNTMRQAVDVYVENYVAHSVKLWELEHQVSKLDIDTYVVFAVTKEEAFDKIKASIFEDYSRYDAQRIVSNLDSDSVKEVRGGVSCVRQSYD